jgi:hypothetical protein
VKIATDIDEILNLFGTETRDFKFKNKCPYDPNIEKYLSTKFVKANENEFPLSLLDIMESNGLKVVLENTRGFSETAYQANSAVKP